MKKIFLTFVLAIVSSVWMMSEAGERWCMPTVRSLIQTWIRTEGIFQSASAPCAEGEECPTCLTIVMETDDKTYYLVSESKEIVDLLENVTIGTHAIIEGQPFSSKGIDYICVSNCYVITEPIGQPEGLLGRWLSVSNEENVSILTFDRSDMTPPYEGLVVAHNGIYGQEFSYYRDGDKINFISANTTGYSFSSQFSIEANTKLTIDSFYFYGNLSPLGTFYRDESKLADAQVLLSGRWYIANITDTIFYSFLPDQTTASPNGLGYVLNVQGDEKVQDACSYKIEQKEDGRWIMTFYKYNVSGDGAREFSYQLCTLTMSEMVWMEEVDGEQHFTYFKHLDEADNESGLPTDTIPLYARDDSGSSTVDPVDPNQIYATLTGNVLTIHNRTGAQVTFTLNNTSVNNVAARVRKNGQPTTFTESISVELTEDGLYEIWLTSEEWNYSVFGTINYVRSATTITKEEPASTTKKVLRGTQILIERGEHVYDTEGKMVK